MVKITESTITMVIKNQLKLRNYAKNAPHDSGALPLVLLINYQLSNFKHCDNYIFRIYF